MCLARPVFRAGRAYEPRPRSQRARVGRGRDPAGSAVPQRPGARVERRAGGVDVVDEQDPLGRRGCGR